MVIVYQGTWHHTMVGPVRGPQPNVYKYQGYGNLAPTRGATTFRIDHYLHVVAPLVGARVENICRYKK
jgi:hypothetical protein